MREPEAHEVVRALAERGLTVATGESLTAGLVAATLADVPGCSSVLEGGVVAYQPRIKEALLHVGPDALAEGVVTQRVAEAMAEGARAALCADVGIGTTGVAGPEPHDGAPVGSVWIAVATETATWSRHLQLDGDRAEIRHETVRATWALVLEAIGA